MNPSDLSGMELAERFCEVCYGDRTPAHFQHERDDYCRDYTPRVHEDANECEAWAMRWVREQGLIWSTGACEGEPVEYWAELELYSDEPAKLFDIIEHGTDWKEAFVRACVAAGQALQQSKGEA